MATSPSNSPPGGWRRVVFSAECDEFGDCPICGIDYTECDCPGPTQDGIEYKIINGILYGRPEDDAY